jgi:molybdopterin converting factor small subunit
MRKVDKVLVEVLYFTEFKIITRKETEIFELSGNNLEKLLDLLFKQYPSLKNVIWDEENQKLNNIISLIINNQAIHEKNPSLISLKNKDKISFLLPVSGG